MRSQGAASEPVSARILSSIGRTGPRMIPKAAPKKKGVLWGQPARVNSKRYYADLSVPSSTRARRNHCAACAAVPAIFDAINSKPRRHRRKTCEQDSEDERAACGFNVRFQGAATAVFTDIFDLHVRFQSGLLLNATQQCRLSLLLSSATSLATLHLPRTFLQATRPSAGGCVHRVP